MAVRNSKSAFFALATAGGLWAWRNRDKIQGWVNQRTSNPNNNLDPRMLNEGTHQRDDQAPKDANEVQRDPFASGI